MESTDHTTKQQLEEKAKAYIQQQKEQNLEPTREGWLKVLEEDFKDGLADIWDSAVDTWQIVMGNPEKK